MTKKKFLRPLYEYVPLKELNLLKRFTVLAFLPITIVVVALGFILTDLITNDLIDGEAWHTMMHTNIFAGKFLTEDDFKKDNPLNKEHFENTLMPVLNSSEEYLRIKVYDSEGTVLWSDKKELIGINFFQSNEDLREALTGKLTKRLGKFKKTEHIYEKVFKKGMEVYVPIKIHGKVTGVIETYRVPAQLFRNIKKTHLFVWVLSALCGCFIYFSLYWLVKSSYLNQLALENNLHISKNRLFHLIDGLKDGVALVDGDCRILTINKPLADAFNISVREALEKNISQLIFKTATDKMLKACGETCIRNLESSFDFVVEKQGSTKKRFFLVDCIPLSNISDNLAGNLSNGNDISKYAVVVLRDLTKEKNLTEELIRSEKLATIGTLFPKISHEIRNPLNALELGLLSIQERYPNENMLELLLNSKDKLLNISNDLLAFSRIKEDEFTQVNINDVIIDAMAFLRDTTGQIKYHNISEDYKGSCFVRGIYGKLEQLFINLIINASQSMEKKDSSKQFLSVGTYMEENELVAFVSDTGAGIKKEDYDNIFDPFFTTKEEGLGTGLGMAIVKEIADRHSAKINFESEEEKGTTFYISFKCIDNENKKT